MKSLLLLLLSEPCDDCGKFATETESESFVRVVSRCQPVRRKVRKVRRRRRKVRRTKAAELSASRTVNQDNRTLATT